MPNSEETKNLLFQICEKYGLLPKDALIIALCIEHKINNFITLDNDFRNVRLEENIKLIYSIEDI